MTTTARTIWAHTRWLAIQAAFAYAVWHGAYEGNVYAARAVLFVAWVNLLMHLAYLSNGCVKTLAENKKHVVIYGQLQWYIDTAVTLLIVAAGWYVTASAWMLAAILEYAGEAQVEKVRKAAEKTEGK